MSENIVDLLDVEESVFRGRLAGKSVRRLAREHRLTIAATEQIIESMVPTIDRRMRLMALQLDLERLDQLQEVFYTKALDGNVQACAILLKCQERRASLLGLGPVHIDPVQLQDDVHPGPNSTEQLLAALDAIAAETQPLRLVANNPAPGSVNDPPTDTPPAA